MTPKKCMSIAKSLTNTQHMELEPLCPGHSKTKLTKRLVGGKCQRYADFFLISVKESLHKCQQGSIF